MKIHNLLKNPNDLPPIGKYNNHQESDEVLVVYRTVEYNEQTNNYEFEITSINRAFYCYEDNEWYSYYDLPLCRMTDILSCGGGQEIESVEYLLKDECYKYPKELVDKMTRVKTFKCEELDSNTEYVLIKEIVGWFEIPTYKEFLNELL